MALMANNDQGGKRAVVVADSFFYGEAWLAEWLLRNGWRVDVAAPASGGTKPMDQEAAMRALGASIWAASGQLRHLRTRDDAVGRYDLGVLHADYPVSLASGFLCEDGWESVLRNCARLVVMALNFARRWKAPVHMLKRWPFLGARRAMLVALDERRGSLPLRVLFACRHLGGAPHMQFLLDPRLAQRLREGGDPRKPRRYRIGFAGSANADREAVLAAMRGLAGERGYAIRDARTPGWLDNKAPAGREVLIQLDLAGEGRARDPGEYLDYLDMCDFQLCPGGAGFWTVRAYESCLRFSVPISERKQIEDFLGREIGRHAVAVSQSGWRNAAADCLTASAGAVSAMRENLAKSAAALLRRQEALAAEIAGA